MEVYAPVPHHGNYCFAGEDYPAGALLLPAGTRIGAVEVGILAGMGLAEVPVRPRPRVALLTTGDEVTAPGQPLEQGRIYNQNLWLTAARLTELGAELTVARQLPDDAAAVAQAVQEAAADADFVLTTGGVSVGKKDILHAVTAQLGVDSGILEGPHEAGQPGAVLEVERRAGAEPVRQSLWGGGSYRAAGAAHAGSPDRLPGSCAGAPPGGAAKRLCKGQPQPALRPGICQDGQVTLPQGLHASGVLSSMQGCNCMLDLSAGSPPLEPGQSVDVVML